QDTLNGDLTSKLFDWVTSVFFFAYALCQVPGAIASKLFYPASGLRALGCQLDFDDTFKSTAFNFGGLMTGRVFLGIFEAGFVPAITLYISFFYAKEEMGMWMAYWFGFVAVAGFSIFLLTFGGLIAFGVQKAHAAIHNWRI
ncbi:hypothetical protein DFH08DRAFT_660517, partial [Mycena albidolilacea]